MLGRREPWRRAGVTRQAGLSEDGTALPSSTWAEELGSPDGAWARVFWKDLDNFLWTLKFEFPIIFPCHKIFFF